MTFRNKTREIKLAWLSADQLEAKCAEQGSTLEFKFHTTMFSGDRLVLTTNDGDVFLAEVVDQDAHGTLVEMI